MNHIKNRDRHILSESSSKGVCPYFYNKIVRPIGFILIAFLWTQNLLAEPATTGSLEPVRIKTLETTSGTVTSVSSSNIAVAYKQTADAEYEMSLPIDKEVKLEYYYQASDIKAGDTVKLQYEKVVESPGEPNERTTMTVKKIRLVKKAPKERES